MASAWHMPGMLFPCWVLVGDMSAPVGANRTFSHLPSEKPRIISEQNTEAEQPQPDPPA